MDKVEFKKVSKSLSFGVDWLNGHVQYDDVLKFFSKLRKISPKLDFKRWVKAPQGIYAYTERYLLNGHNAFQIAYNPLSEEAFYTAQTKENTSYDNGNFGIFLTLSGSGCRELENMETDKNCLSELLFLLYDLGFKATRFDVYLDCFDRKIAPLKVIREAFRYFYQPQVGKCTLTTNFTRNVSAAKDKQNVVIYRNVSVDNKVYYNYQLGGHGSNTGMFRCYNKLDEQQANLTPKGFEQLKSEYGFSDFWYRFEYEVHKDRANQAFQACMKSFSDEHKVFGYAGLWLSCCLMFFRIVVPRSFGSALRNCPNEDTWQSFVNLVTDLTQYFVQLGGQAQFSFPAIPYILENLNRFERHLDHTKLRDLKRDILVKIDRGKFNHNLEASRKWFGTSKCDKWMEDVAKANGLELFEVQLIAMSCIA